MKRIISVLLSFGLVSFALLADSMEVQHPELGSMMWMLFFIGGVILLIWQARQRNISPAIAAIALIPFLNLLLIPVVSILLAVLPTKKSKSQL